MEKLSSMKADKKVEVKEINGDHHFQSRITSIGVTVGSVVEVLQNNKRQPTLIFCRDTVIAINKKEADKILVEVI